MNGQSGKVSKNSPISQVLKLGLKRILEAWARSRSWVVSDAESRHRVCVAWGSSGSCIPRLCSAVSFSPAFSPSSAHGTQCCRKGDPFKGPREGSCLTVRNGLSEETHMRTKQETIGKGRPGGEHQGKGPRKTALPHGSQSQLLWWWN